MGWFEKQLLAREKKKSNSKRVVLKSRPPVDVGSKVLKWWKGKIEALKSRKIGMKSGGIKKQESGKRPSQGARLEVVGGKKERGP